MRVNMKIILIIFCIILINLANNTYSLPAININESLIDNLKNISQIETFPVIYSETYIINNDLDDKYLLHREYAGQIMEMIKRDWMISKSKSIEELKQMIYYCDIIKQKNEKNYGYGNFILNHYVDDYIITNLYVKLVNNEITSNDTEIIEYINYTPEIKSFWFRMAETEFDSSLFDYEEILQMNVRERIKLLSQVIENNFKYDEELFDNMMDFRISSYWDTRSVFGVILCSNAIQFNYRFGLKLLFVYFESGYSMPEDERDFKKNLKKILKANKEYWISPVISSIRVMYTYWSGYCWDIYHRFYDNKGKILSDYLLP